jgi:hypothetical protein
MPCGNHGKMPSRRTEGNPRGRDLAKSRHGVRRLAWADTDGTVDVADLDAVQYSDRPIVRK